SFTAQSDASSRNAGGAGMTFNNSGTFTKSGSNGLTTFVSNVFNNSGTVTISSGTLDLQGGGTSTGILNTMTGTAVDFDGTNYFLNSGTALQGAGLYSVPGTFDILTINANLTVQNFGQNAGNINNTAALTITH